MIRASLVIGLLSTVAVPALAQSPAAQENAATPQAAVAEAAPVAAQASDAPGDIVVTAFKREERLNRVPMSINALSSTQLQKLAIKDVSDLTRAVPGFQATESGFSQPIYFLRGVGFYDTSLQSKPTVSVYQDEVPFALSPLSLGAAFDVQRVEVLKGPQGTLYGQNATGGAINFIANKPTDSLRFGADASYGRFNDADLSGFVSGPITSTLTARIAVRHEQSGDWQRSYTHNATNGAKNFTQGRFILDWKPSSRFKAELTLSGFADRGDTQAAQFRKAFQQTPTTPLAAGFAVYPVAPANDRAADFGSDIPLDKHNYFGSASLRLDYALTDDLNFTSLTSYGYYKERYGLDLDGTTFGVFGDYVSGKVRAFTQEGRLSGQTIDGKLHFVAGVNYEHDHVNETQTGVGNDASSTHAFERFGVGIIDRSPAQAESRFDSKAVFGNVDYDLGSHFTVHGGVRYTQTDIDFAGCLLSAGSGALGAGLSIIFKITPPIQIGQCATLTGSVPGLVVRSLDQHNVSWRGGLDWKPSDNWLFYGNISRGFKSGGFPNLGATSAAQYTPVVQEEVTAYELGFKIAADRRIEVTAAGFYYDYKNKQLKGRIVVPIFGAINAIVNVPKSYILGAEGQVTWRPDEHFRLSAGGTYLKSKVRGTFVNYGFDGNLADFGGARFPYTPRWQANADAEYDLPVSANWNGFVGGTVTYRSDTNSQFITNALFDIRPYTLIDARIGAETHDGRIRVMLQGQNLTNKYYWTQAIRTGDAIVRYAGMPVTWKLSLSYRY